MNTDSSTSQHSTPVVSTYYTRLGLHPSASALEIRRAYRELSKRYHPDTTVLDAEVATIRFHQLNEAYATLSNVERRQIYDRSIGYSRFYQVQAPLDLRNSESSPSYPDSAYLDPSDRPLSSGELFALFILALTFMLCLGLAIAVAWLHPELATPSFSLPPS